jgi:hypothetical protein
MPYIAQEQRAAINEPPQELISQIRESLVDERDGILNYCISEMVCQSMCPPSGEWRYRLLERCIGIVECCKLELYRRLVGPYEDKCIQKNGDIESYHQS